MNVNPCLISTICWIVGLMGLPSIDRRNQWNTDLRKWFIKHKKKSAWQAEPHTVSQSFLSCPRLSFVFFPHERPQGQWPLCVAPRDIWWLNHTLLARAGLCWAAWVSHALLIFCRYLLNQNILKINKNWSLSFQWHIRMLFHCLSWLSTGSCVVRKHCSAWCRYSLLVHCIYPKCLDRIQGNLQKFSQIDAFLWAGMNHGALNC